MDKTIVLPSPPERPLSSDCCGNGCNPCILDVYEEDLRIWQLECQALQNGQPLLPATTKEEDQPLVTIEPDKYKAFSIISISKETHDTLRYRFSLQQSQTLGLAIGQHVVVRVTSPNRSTFTRQYTPVSPLDAKGYFELLIKIYSNGRMSKYIKEWRVGDHIEMRGPLGYIEYTPNKYKHLLILCAGTGIAPMCQIIHAVLENEEEETRIRLLYACRTYQDLLAKSDLDDWQRYWNFSSLYILSQEPTIPEYSYKYGDSIQRGHINKSTLYSELEEKQENTFVVVCGTSSFDSDMLNYLEELGIPQDHIHKF